MVLLSAYIYASFKYLKKCFKQLRHASINADVDAYSKMG